MDGENAQVCERGKEVQQCNCLLTNYPTISWAFVCVMCFAAAQDE